MRASRVGVKFRTAICLAKTRTAIISCQNESMRSPFEPTELNEAVRCCEIRRVEALLQLCREPSDVDDPSHSYTTLMIAASEDHKGHNHRYPLMLKMLWKRYKELDANLHEVLERTIKYAGSRWNVLGQACQCRDPERVRVVLDMYEEVYGDTKSIPNIHQCMIRMHSSVRLLFEGNLPPAMAPEKAPSRKRKSKGSIPTKTKKRLRVKARVKEEPVEQRAKETYSWAERRYERKVRTGEQQFNRMKIEDHDRLLDTLAHLGVENERLRNALREALEAKSLLHRALERKEHENDQLREALTKSSSQLNER